MKTESQIQSWNWFAARLVFEIVTEKVPDKSQFEEQIRLIQAISMDDAYRKSIRYGASEETGLQNISGGSVSWVFRGVAGLTPLQNLHDGIEIHYRIEETDQPEQYRNWISSRFNHLLTPHFG